MDDVEKLGAGGNAGVVKKDPFIPSRGRGPVMDVGLEEEEERHL